MYRTIIGAALASLALTGTAQAHAPLSLRDGRAAIYKYEDAAEYQVYLGHCAHERHGAVVCNVRQRLEVVPDKGRSYFTWMSASDLARRTSHSIRVTPLEGTVDMRNPAPY